MQIGDHLGRIPAQFIGHTDHTDDISIDCHDHRSSAHGRESLRRVNGLGRACDAVLLKQCKVSDQDSVTVGVDRDSLPRHWLGVPR